MRLKPWEWAAQALPSRIAQSQSDLWQDIAPIRADLFGIERLEHHAQTLAAAEQVVTDTAVRNPRLALRVKDNGAVLLAAYRTCAAALQAGDTITPAAEWLLDNFHLVEQQLRGIRDDLPPGYYRQLPKLANGPFKGYPRVLSIAWAYVAHTDSLISGAVLTRFVRAYQQSNPLMIGELWAVAITLRIVLIENMRRLAVDIAEGHRQRQHADAIVNAVLAAENNAEQSPLSVMQTAVRPYETAPLPEIIAGQIAKRLRGFDPAKTPLSAWLEDRLRRQGMTVDEVVADAQMRLASSNVTMRNIITSMRLVSEMDWADFFEEVSLVDARLRVNPVFGEMDFTTRNRYRTAIEVIARGTERTEIEVTEAALALAKSGDTDHRSETGYWLIGKGRGALEAELKFKPSLGLRAYRWIGRRGLAGYLGAIAAVSLAVLSVGLSLAQSQGGSLLAVTLLAITGLAVAVEVGTAVVDLIITRTVAPSPLPGFELAKGIPPDLRSLVAVPVLLHGVDDLHAQIEQLEVRHLASTGGALHYALLSDAVDAAEQTTPADDALIAAALAAIAALNQRYPSDHGPLFYFLHRHRLWNPAEGVWMGWERKRGKLTELNRLLRGATDTSFSVISSPLPQDIRYVITLDADTRVLHGTVRQMIGKMAHPLNRPIFDEGLRRVTAGYGLLQPRVTADLPIGAHGSLYQRIFSSMGGIDPYVTATSDVYQDLFGEGSFTGKGIYDVDVFARALEGRVPENTMLSHDLFEGVFARAALASDIEVVEDFPTRYDVDIRRRHRWVRGDWQLLPWIFGARGRGVGRLPALGRWKMLDNLRRSLLAPMAILTLFLGWMMPPAVALIWTTWVVAMLAVPRVLPLPFGLVPTKWDVTLRSHFDALGKDVLTALGQIALSMILLADTAAAMGDAIVRTLWRMTVSHRHLLEWMTAAQLGGSGLPSGVAQYLRMAPGLVLGLGACTIAAWVNPSLLPWLIPFALVWAAAPAVARAISQLRVARPMRPLSIDQARALRLTARRTWRYFETFVTAQENFLPPDNFQETPKPAIANRTSPTNIGLYLLSTVVARDMGWTSQTAALRRMKDTLQTVQRMPRYRGHVYNWHDTRDLRVLDPAYISTVDSGNLAGHLIAIAQSCVAWKTEAVAEATLRQSLRDTAYLARQCGGSGADDLALAGHLDAIMRAGTALAALLHNTAAAHDLAVKTAGAESDLAFWTGVTHQTLQDHLADQSAPLNSDLLAEVEAIARAIAIEMDFAFLLEPDKKLLSIGFSLATNRLDANCYDLLASEARLASLFAIAKGDVDTRHWFRLGRTATPVGSGAALISWSGSMFEYLMPSLVMRAPVGSVLEQTNQLIVGYQQDYGAVIGVPWGISESSYNARDLEMIYQYSNFGVPGLGLKRGLSENQVIAPYATGLAAMVDPVAAVQNYDRLAALGAQGRFGFYEAVDFTPTRVPVDDDHVIVRSFMAHHQGMTITSIANALQNGTLRNRFHAEPMIQGVELLLHERVPRDVAIAPPRAKDVLVGAVQITDVPTMRVFDAPVAASPTAHLLSNGNYGVMLTATGEGFSRWRDLAITRWRAEPTQAALGSFIFLRDTASGKLWSAGVQPLFADTTGQRAVFSEHHAAFTCQAPQLVTTTEVVVSAEDDAEARRVTLTNTSRNAREVDVTSYCELVLAPQASDQAHPAFSKMFVVTDYLPELGVIIATRRRRSAEDPEVWAAHIAVVEGDESGPMEFETDRAKFIGRGRSMQDAEMANKPLSGTTGTVLDPIFSIRRRVTVAPGGVTRVTFWTMIAETPAALLDLVDRHRDSAAYARAATLSWTQAQVQLRHLGISHADADDFQTLGGMVMRNDGRLRAAPLQIARGAAPQSALWALGISGDLPIVLLQIDDAQDIGVLQHVLSAHEYWGLRQLAVDIVILNDRLSSYVQDLQIAIDSAVRVAQARPQVVGIHAPAKGAIFTVRADIINPDARAHLLAAARLVIVASRGDISQQLSLLAAPQAIAAPKPKTVPRIVPQTMAHPPLPALEFFNGTGGFAEQGREYVTVLRNGATTPAPWLNVIANPSFGFQVSAEGSGHIWSENSRENQITPWSNDPVSDPAGDAIYLHDLETDEVWTPTALPIRGLGTYIARHGFGYSTFEHARNGIATTMVQFVPLDAAVKISRLTLHNTGASVRKLAITGYAEWVLGASRSATAPYVITKPDPATGAILAQNTFSTAFPGRIAFADLGAETTSFTADRAEFIGHGGTLAAPAALNGRPLSGRTGPALDPCAALQRHVTLQPGARVEIVFLIGQAENEAAASALVARMRDADLDASMAAVTGHWTQLLTTVQITSPDRAMDIMLNGWLLYQTLACRIWARAGFYQASGAYGFRDQLQDGMALTFGQPDMTRTHLLRAASRQFPEGDVQHWWLPHSGQGVRTRISDDRVWLGYGVARYVAVSGDLAILDEELPFLQGPAVPAGAHDDFYQPVISENTASLFEHCALGLDQAIELTGANGMPLIGTGDWNDGMNRVGEAGQGTSVWLGWLLIATIDMMAPLADSRDAARAARWRAHAHAVRTAIEAQGWDGAWYRRGTFDDGTILGSASSEECQIDSIAQSWAVLSGAADPARAQIAMASMMEHLVRPDPGLALLFTPPFDRTALDPGYIKGYPPGLRENGGQYSHAAMWAILAQAKLGNGDAAGALFAMLNPINHALTPEAAAHYRVEPYVIAADVYSTPPHEGRGGWTWYTGSAGWMHRAGVEGLLGLSRAGETLMVNPCFPKAWPQISAVVTLGEAQIRITVVNPQQTGRGIVAAQLDQAALSVGENGVQISIEQGAHDLVITLGVA